MVVHDGKLTVSQEFLDGIVQATVDEAQRLCLLHGEFTGLERVGSFAAEAAIIPIAVMIAHETEGVENELESLIQKFASSIRQLRKEERGQK